MKLARQAATMEELATTTWEGRDAAAATGISVAKSLFAYIMALNSNLESKMPDQNYVYWRLVASSACLAANRIAKCERRLISKC